MEKIKLFTWLAIMLMSLVSLSLLQAQQGETLSRLGKAFLVGGTRTLLGSTDERKKETQHPYVATNKPGVCFSHVAYKEVSFPDCEGLIGDELKRCCFAKDKDDVVPYEPVNYPEWMKSDPFFARNIGQTQSLN